MPADDHTSARAHASSIIVAVVVAIIFATGAPWWWPYLTHHIIHAAVTQKPRKGDSANRTRPPVRNDRATQLIRALVPAGIVGPAARVEYIFRGFPHYGSAACGLPLAKGGKAAAQEVIDVGDASIWETLIAWNTIADAGRYIVNDERAIKDGDGKCVKTSLGVTGQSSGEYPGRPPSDCVDPGAFLAAQTSNDSKSLLKMSPTGFVIDVQCGRVTIGVLTQSLSGKAVTLKTAESYLKTAVKYFDQLGSPESVGASS